MAFSCLSSSPSAAKHCLKLQRSLAGSSQWLATALFPVMRCDPAHLRLRISARYGIDAFTPVINYPEIAILGLGAIRREPVFMADDRVVARQRMIQPDFRSRGRQWLTRGGISERYRTGISDPAAFCLNFG